MILNLSSSFKKSNIDEYTMLQKGTTTTVHLVIYYDWVPMIVWALGDMWYMLWRTDSILFLNPNNFRIWVGKRTVVV